PGDDPLEDDRVRSREVREASADRRRGPGHAVAAAKTLPHEEPPVSVTQEQVLAALRTVQDPDLHKDIVSLEFVKDVKIRGGEVDFTIELTTPACPVRDEMKAEAERKVSALPGVSAARATMTSNVRARGGFGRQALPGIRNILAVGAGKGGV